MRRDRTRAVEGVVGVLGVGLLLAACAGVAPQDEGARAADAERGRELYATNCAQCHGADANGTQVGPPFLSDVYVPSHHADEAFQRAVAAGVQPHHWDFGPMPPVQGLDRQDVADIVAHVRALQRDAGLLDEG